MKDGNVAPDADFNPKGLHNLFAKKKARKIQQNYNHNAAVPINKNHYHHQNVAPVINQQHQYQHHNVAAPINQTQYHNHNTAAPVINQHHQDDNQKSAEPINKDQIVYKLQGRPTEVVKREHQSLAAMMRATGTIAKQHAEVTSDLDRLSEVSEIDEVILTEMCKDVARAFGEDVDSLENRTSEGVADLVRQSLETVIHNQPSVQGVSDVDMEEQKKLLAFFESQQTKKEEKKKVDMIEVAPDLTLPLRSADSTYKAILVNKVTTVTCSSCKNTLTTPNDVTMAICADCNVCISLNGNDDVDAQTNGSIGLAIKDLDIAMWFSTRTSAELKITASELERIQEN